jgi:hypothetical protein
VLIFLQGVHGLYSLHLVVPFVPAFLDVMQWREKASAVAISGPQQTYAKQTAY